MAAIPATTPLVMNNTPAAGNVNSGATYNPSYAPQGATYQNFNNANPATNGSAPSQVAPGAKLSAPTSYPVVTSGPATAAYNAAQTDYQNNIAPKIQAASQNQAASSQLPVIQGYNVSATPTGNMGETKATNQVTGGVYYITPQQPAATANDIKSILSSPENGSTGPSNPPATTGTPATQTPSQVAQNQTGVNPTTENANYQSSVTGLNDEISQAYKSFYDTISSIMSGSFPLSAPQQALVNATNQAFKQMTDQASLKAAALSSETGGVSSKVNAAAGELTNITAQQAATIAKLEIGFQDRNYQMVTEQYKAFKDLEASKLDTLDKLHTSVMDTYNKAVAAAESQRTFDQTVFKNAEDLKRSRYEFRDLKDAMGNTIGTQVFDKTAGSVVHTESNGAADSGSPTPTVTTDVVTGKPDPASQEAFLQTIPSAFRELVKGVAEYRVSPPNSRTKTGAQILAWAAKYNPTLADGSGGFDEKTWTARSNYYKNLTNGTSQLSQGLTAANKTINHLAAFTSAVNRLNNGPLFSTVNAAGTAIEGKLGAVFGNTNVQNNAKEADTEANGLKDEMAKFFKGTGASDVNSIEDWGKSLDRNAPPGELRGMVQGALTLFTGQLSPVLEQFKSTMGREPTAQEMGLILRPETVAKLSQFKDAGFRIDLPNIPYTDPVAFAKADPGNAEILANIRSQFPELSPAQALQLAQTQ